MSIIKIQAISEMIRIRRSHLNLVQVTIRLLEFNWREETRLSIEDYVNRLRIEINEIDEMINAELDAVTAELLEDELKK